MLLQCVFCAVRREGDKVKQYRAAGLAARVSTIVYAYFMCLPSLFSTECLSVFVDVLV